MQVAIGPHEQVTRRIVRVERRYGGITRWALLIVSAIAFWFWRGASLLSVEGRAADIYIILGYVLLSAVCGIGIVPPRILRRYRAFREDAPARRAFLVASHVIDHIYIAAIIAQTGGPQSDFYLFFAIFALRASLYYAFLRATLYISFSSGIFFVISSYISAGSLYFIADRAFLFRYASLFALVAGAMALGWLIERRQQSISDLDADLSQKSEALADQTEVVQRTANDLANRLLELRSLQESVKAINSELELDELLQLIVENATQVLRGARCSISLVDEKREFVSTAAVAGVSKDQLHRTSLRIGQGVSGWVVQNRQSVLMDDVTRDRRYIHVEDWPVASLVSVPLVSDGRVIGTLTATSENHLAFSDSDVSLLDAFGDQAAVAVKNGRLYEQLLREEQQTARLYQSVLEKSNELEAILTGIGDGVIVVDPMLRLLMMNPVAARVFRVLRVPEQGVRLPEIVASRDLLGLAEETISGADAPIIREITLEAEGDRSRIYQALSSVIKGGDGGNRGVVIVMRDITAQKELEQMKNDFLSVVSHELRTPLHSIKGFVDIILMGKTGEINDLQRDFLTTVKESTSNLQRLIDDLLEFTRMEAGQIKLRPAEISVYDLAERVIEQLSPLAQQGDLTLANRINESIPLVEADAMRIEQVLTNLMSNAIKFTPANGLVEVSAIDQGDFVQVSVRDTGIGISQADLAQVFVRFYQVDSSASRSYRGAGLGLTICKFIVEYHHGRIWVESEEGVGSVFRFTLPKQLPKDEALVIDFTTPARRS